MDNDLNENLINLLKMAARKSGARYADHMLVKCKYGLAHYTMAMEFLSSLEFRLGNIGSDKFYTDNLKYDDVIKGMEEVVYALSVCEFYGRSDDVEAIGWILKNFNDYLKKAGVR